MDLNIQACIGMPPTEVIPIIYKEQISSGKMNLHDLAPIGYVFGLWELCFPKVTKKNSEKLVKLLRLTGEVHPHFFYMVQEAYDKQETKELEAFKKMYLRKLEKEEKEKELAKLRNNNPTKIL